MTQDDMNEPAPFEPADVESAHSEIDALLDGELVDKDALRLALDQADARDYLVDALLLRQMTRELEPARFAIPGTPRSPFARGMRWLAAGVVLAVSAGAGYAYGQGSRIDTPPGLVEVTFDNNPAPPAPEPTRSIRFEPGVNWESGRRSH
jgi:hypothetical protein